MVHAVSFTVDKEPVHAACLESQLSSADLNDLQLRTTVTGAKGVHRFAKKNLGASSELGAKRWDVEIHKF